MDLQRLQNIVGALSLAISDGLTDRARQLLPRSEPAAALAIIGRSPGWTISQLSNDLGLSHAATVRLIDRLVADGLVERSRSILDGRAVSLALTAEGSARYDRLLETRQEQLSDLLSRLSATEMLALESICEKLLPRAVETLSDHSRACRFCDVACCGDCPIDARPLS